MKPITAIVATVFCLTVGTGAFAQSRDTTITATSNKTFTIKLQFSPSAGYSWSLSDSLNKSFLKLISTTNETLPHKIGVVGGPGLQVFTLKALKKGTANVKLVYGQPWIKPAPADYKKLNFTVKIN